MIRLFLSFSLLYFLTDLTLAQLPEPKAKIVPAIFDFGKVEPGAIVNGKFSLSNVGNAPLEIQKVVASCGCLITDIPKKILQPNEVVELNAKFNSKGFFGPQLKNIRVYTNEANSILLTMKGEVLREFKIEPAQVFFGDVLKGTERKVKLELITTKQDLNFGEISSKSEFVQVNVLDSHASQGNQVKTLELSIKPDAPVGTIRSIVLVHTNSVNEPVISIPIFAKIQGELQLSPSYVSFDLLEGPLSSHIIRTIDLHNVGLDSPQIVSIESDNPFVVGTFKVLKPGKLFAIQILLSEKSRGIVRAKVTITTDKSDDSYKSVILPVYAFIVDKGE